MNKFSVIIPTHNRAEKLLRAIKSVLDQTYKEFEIIVVDDGSYDDTFERIKRLQAAGRDRVPLLYIRMVRQQRLIARNKGMRLAMNDWIVWMDDDDELFPDYLAEFDKAIKERRDLSVFQCCVQFFKIVEGKEIKLRILKPKQLPEIDYNKLYEEKQYDVKEIERPPHFVSGCITTGQFIFHKDCLEKTGLLPYTHLYGEFAIQSGIPGYGWVPPQPPRFPERRVQVLGNPFGEDFYMFYKLTRYYNVCSINKVLYKKNCR